MISNVLNLILLLHFVLTLLVGAFAIVLPETLAKIGMLDAGIDLDPAGKAYGMFFGVTLVGMAAVLWLARVSGSSPARRLTLQAMFFHLGIGMLVCLCLPVPLLTKLVAFILFSILFLGYGFVWLYRPIEI